MQHDIWRIIGILFLWFIAGLALGYPLIGLLLGAITALLWQTRRLHRLYRWIQQPHKFRLGDTTGQLYLIHRLLNRRFKSEQHRKRLLSNSLSHFRQAVSAFPDGIILLGKERKIEWANRQAETLLGINWPGDAGVKFDDLVRNPALFPLLAALDANPHQVPGEGKEIRVKARTLNIKFIPYTENTQMVLVRDVSRLFKINQMQTDFVANVSHELKTPLTVLKGYLEIFKDNADLPTSLEKPVTQMTSQAERMHAIVTDLLFLSKLENSLQPASKNLVEVSTLVNTIIDIIQPSIKAQSHKLELDIDHSLVLLGEQNELHSAFANLIVNASNYTAKGGVIHIRWRAEATEGGRFSVEDNGAGIPAEHLPRITERFYRIDSDRSRERGGTGLGLAIVKHVLQRHEASLQIESEEGTGSKFICTFPPARCQSGEAIRTGS